MLKKVNLMFQVLADPFKSYNIFKNPYLNKYVNINQIKVGK